MGQIGSVYKQPETEVDDSCHSWRVPSKWIGEQGELGNQQGEQGELGNQQGEQGELGNQQGEQRGVRHVYM